jgi:SMI1 / KNR4 family (SUKH-1)
MPADPIEVLSRVRSGGLVDKRGGAIRLDFAEPLIPAEIDDLRAQVGAQLPSELTAVLAETRAIDGVEPIDLTGRTMDVEAGELSPAGIPIATDGAGNFWLLDLTPDDRETAPVFFLCHDPPVFAFQSPTLGDFLYELFRKYEPPQRSLVRDVQEERVHEIWRRSPGVIGRDTALGADDELSAFASSLEESFEIVDLRAPEVGVGFAWGRHGPRTELRRHGYSRLFAYGPPEKKQGFFSRLRGRQGTA